MLTSLERSKLEIPEDDPRNPATIADNVGDNVGDVAGMGADLFGSYVATVLAAMVLGNYVINDMGGSIADNYGGMSTIVLPLIISALGIVFSILGSLVIRVNDGAKEPEVQAALNRGKLGFHHPHGGGLLFPHCQHAAPDPADGFLR